MSSLVDLRSRTTSYSLAMLRFYSGVKEGFKGGKSEAEIRKSLDLSSWDTLERSYVIGRNINRAYLEIERDSFDE